MLTRTIVSAAPGYYVLSPVHGSPGSLSYHPGDPFDLTEEELFERAGSWRGVWQTVRYLATKRWRAWFPPAKDGHKPLASLSEPKVMFYDHSPVVAWMVTHDGVEVVSVTPIEMDAGRGHRFSAEHDAIAGPSEDYGEFVYFPPIQGGSGGNTIDGATQQEILDEFRRRERDRKAARPPLVVVPKDAS